MALHAMGCDDAAFMGPASDGSFTAEFDREAPTFTGAVVSALDAIRSALPAARLLRVLPDDLVTVAAIAARTGRTDESVRLLCQGRRGPGGFPPAAGWINEKTQVWRWTDVARWFSEALDESPAGAEHAAFLAALDLAARAGDLRERPDQLEALLRFLPKDLAPAWFTQRQDDVGLRSLLLAGESPNAGQVRRAVINHERESRTTPRSSM